MILEPGQAIYHPYFGPGVVGEITRARDSGCDLDQHRIEFADGTCRDIVGTQSLCLPADVSRSYPEFEPGDAVHHPRFGYGTIAASHVSPEPGAEFEYTIDFDRVGRYVIVAWRGLLRSAVGLDRQRRLGISPPALNAAAQMSPAERREYVASRDGVPAHVQAMAGSARFDLYREWLYRHVAAPYDAFYAGLDPADSPAVWRFIEQRYLDRYDLLLQVCSVPACEGLWPIDYPAGALRTDLAVNFGDYGIPESIVDALEQWSVYKEDVEFDYAHDGGPRPDFDALHARGLALAGAVKRHAGPCVYVEIRPFREVLWIDGATVEAPIPEPIARCLSPHDI